MKLKQVINIRFLVFLMFSVFVHSSISAQLYSLTGTEFFVYFDSDSYTLSSKQEQKLKEKLFAIGPSQIKEIYIEGHTDSFASDEYNLQLAANRANSATQYLLEIGVPQRFIKTESFGESQLISELHKDNRRARLYIVYETDNRSSLDPPKFIVITTINKKTKKPMAATLGFDFIDKEMRFSSTDASGKSPAFPLLSDKLEVVASADRFLSAYFNLPEGIIDQPVDTLFYTIELSPVTITGKFTFNSIFFFTDSDEIKPESTPELHKLLAVLQRNQSAHIEIQGHMNFPIDRHNNSIQRKWNMELSYKRAKAINDYLVKSGVKQHRLTYKGMSNFRMKFPLPGNKQEEDQNKRVEVYTLKEI
ncbi:MAG: OmpA family protein [Bacteroidia bacterium]|nr:OmpA family protein [Bacteroidia bacterium]